MQLVQRVEFIKAVCTDRKVLHLGCANYPYTQDSLDKNMLLHSDLQEIASELHGFDYDQPGLDILAKNGFANLSRADLERLEEVASNEAFDVIIAGEMIEHLNNPGLFLTGIQRFMNADTKLVITTINGYCGMRFLYYGLRGRRGRQEPVHPDHVAYYSYATLSLLLQRHGLPVDEFLFYDIGTEHRPHNPWYLNIVNDVFVKIAPQWSDGVIAVCRRAK
ncbi:MAG TPA: methyltransferase domain-containing protein [Pyrinomonadaceae bacterium]|nr:methyltransferase domain-containing protein [Pyrinomonadaceae bacterium]